MLRRGGFRTLPAPLRSYGARPGNRSHVLAAVDVDLGAGDVAGLLRAQIIDGLGDLFGQAETAQRNRLHQLVGARRQDGDDGVAATPPPA